jgi:hypothetical protein
MSDQILQQVESVRIDQRLDVFSALGVLDRRGQMGGEVKWPEVADGAPPGDN